MFNKNVMLFERPDRMRKIVNFERIKGGRLEVNPIKLLEYLQVNEKQKWT